MSPIIVFLAAVYFIGYCIRGSAGGGLVRKTSVGIIAKKRQSCTDHHHGAEILPNHMPTRCYISFQPDKGPRFEVEVPETKFELLFEGERGKLTYRGKKFIRFKHL
jgi:hypothetical protein